MNGFAPSRRGIGASIGNSEDNELTGDSGLTGDSLRAWPCGDGLRFGIRFVITGRAGVSLTGDAPLDVRLANRSSDGMTEERRRGTSGTSPVGCRRDGKSGVPTLTW
jgi:hypothetical protein